MEPPPRIDDLAQFWANDRRLVNDRDWLHQDDREWLSAHEGLFDLNKPAVPFIGDISSAKVIILDTRAGCETEEARKRVLNSGAIEWVGLGTDTIERATAILYDCAYGRRQSLEAGSKLLSELPSVRLARRWLLRCVFPLAGKRERAIVSLGLPCWRFGATLSSAPGVFHPVDVPAV